MEITQVKMFKLEIDFKVSKFKFIREPNKVHAFFNF